MEDLGIYTNIRKSKKAKDGHQLYYADCKICGKTVERYLYDLRHYNQKCQHRKLLENNHIISPEIKNDPQYRRIYDMWRHMILRTKKEYWEKHPTYTGTTVSEEWKNFNNFYYDIQELDGYQLWRDNPKKMIMLDKDTKVPGNKHYSKETCCFLTHADSNRDVHNRHPETLQKARNKFIEDNSIPIKATNKKTGEEIIFSSMKEASRNLNINFRNLWMCLSKEEKYKSCKSVKGWKFEYVEDYKNN